MAPLDHTAVHRYGLVHTPNYCCYSYKPEVLEVVIMTMMWALLLLLLQWLQCLQLLLLRWLLLLRLLLLLGAGCGAELVYL